jgi:hypothetical protein|eukprot:COSAG02_NODE_2123_length_9752_cov_20.875376_2_plen_309_part_00
MARRAGDEPALAVDEPVGVTESPPPELGGRSEVRRWITGDDVALLLEQHSGAQRSREMPLVARLATHVDARDEHGWTLLMHAALRTLPAVVAELLEASADVGCQSTMLKRCEKLGGQLDGAEFPRGSTALSVANARMENGSSEESDAFLVVSLLRGPCRHAGAAAEQLNYRPGLELGEGEEALAASRVSDPRDDHPPLASACSWLPASALPAHYHQTPLQPSESAEEAACREYREAIAESAELRASGDFSGAVDGYRAAVRRYAGDPLRDGQYCVTEPQTTASADSCAIKRQSWDVANQQRTIEWRIS